MATRITLTIEVDDEYADPEDRTGLTEEAFERLMEFVNEFGTLHAGPERSA